MESEARNLYGAGNRSVLCRPKMIWSRYRLYALRDAGLIEPIARGLYRLADAEVAVDLDLIEIARLRGR